jgi:ubiquinone/menaquinone biosynthesis C-methylase UbiE
MADKTESAVYTHGHHSSVLRSHTWRTALNSAAYILPHLKPDMKVLDIGCGPGTITVDMASYVPRGHITGLERAEGVLSQARALAEEKGVKNVDFVVGDANGLSYEDQSFDVVICHQVLQHVRDPIGILKEMYRVTKMGGFVAARESDYGAFVWYPSLDGLSEWSRLYDIVARNNGGEPNAGRMLHSWARQAGLTDVKCSTSTWCYNTKEEIAWWSDLWAERIVMSSFATTAIDAKISTKDDLGNLAKVWRKWGDEEDAWFSVLHGEIIAYKH